MHDLQVEAMDATELDTIEQNAARVKVLAAEIQVIQKNEKKLFKSEINLALKKGERVAELQNIYTYGHFRGANEYQSFQAILFHLKINSSMAYRLIDLHNYSVQHADEFTKARKLPKMTFSRLCAMARRKFSPLGDSRLNGAQNVIHWPDGYKPLVEERAEHLGFTTVPNYIRSLVEKDIGVKMPSAGVVVRVVVQGDQGSMVPQDAQGSLPPPAPEMPASQFGMAWDL